MNSRIRTDIKKFFYTVLGITILGFGVALSVKAGLGTSPLDVLIEMLHFKTGFTVGRITFCAQIIMVIVSLILKPKMVGIGTVMALFLTQFPIDFAYGLIDTSSIFYINLLMVSIGSILTAFGSAMIVHAGLGMGTYEALTFSISDYFQIKYLYVKFTLDAIFMLLLVIFHGTIGIGTIISYLFIGKLITVFLDLFKRIIVFEE